MKQEALGSRSAHTSQNWVWEGRWGESVDGLFERDVKSLGGVDEAGCLGVQVRPHLRRI